MCRKTVSGVLRKKKCEAVLWGGLDEAKGLTFREHEGVNYSKQLLIQNIQNRLLRRSAKRGQIETNVLNVVGSEERLEL